ncbi:hypothetical protein F511_08409 [Dorcoceras hygrometricum]|uniref:Uncharacterized protein n=1 Tax=Dorcoceras hygrometricum TaxID=472368 RepID=A0A2Z7CN31_9LAMI|nr:hypothetical protein F511_08409 [Dorcoceras hygrometricum]
MKVFSDDIVRDHVDCAGRSASWALGGSNFLATGRHVSLSEQQPVDCDHEVRSV